MAGAKELILDDSYGIVMENNKLETVKTALETAFADSCVRIKGEEKTYHRLESYFTWGKVADKLLNL